MKKRIRLKGRIRTYIQFTLYLGLLLLAIDAAVFMLDFRAGLLTFGFTIFYFAITLTLYFYNKPIIMNELISFATEYGQIQRKLLRDLELPYALLDDSGKVIWTNIAFENVVHQPKGYSKSITSLFPTITRDRLPDESGVDEAQYELEYEGCEYVAKFRKISLKEMAEHSDMIDAEGYNGYLIAVYLFDETALHIALQEVDDQSLSVGMIYLDNYEEALESVEEVRRSLLIALIDRKVNKYIASLDGISKKLEKDKYLVIMRKKAVAQLQENRFDLLEEVKTVNIGNEMAVTISIGIGLDGLTYAQNYEFARTAIDLALGRGGDQAVIKTPESITYYGGKSQHDELPEVKLRGLRLAVGGGGIDLLGADPEPFAFHLSGLQEVFRHGIGTGYGGLEQLGRDHSLVPQQVPVRLFQPASEGGKAVVLPGCFDFTLLAVPVSGFAIDACRDSRFLSVDADPAEDGGRAVRFYLVTVDVE